MRAHAALITCFALGGCYNFSGLVGEKNDLAASTDLGAAAPFRSLESVSFPHTGAAIAASDATADGKADLIVALASDPGGFDLWTGRGDGTFAVRTITTGGASVMAMTLADFNADGYVDIATFDRSHYVAISLGPSFDVNNFTHNDIPANALGMTAASLRNNGLVDVILACDSSPPVGVNLFDPLVGTRLDDLQRYGSAPNAAAVAAADFNRDGKADVAYADKENDQISLLVGDGKGGLTTLAGSTISIVKPTLLITADLDLDGNADLVAISQDPQTPQLQVWLSDGKGAFRSKAQLAAPADAAQVLSLDFDRDGKLDLALVSAEQLYLYSGVGDGTFAAIDPIPLELAPDVVVGVAAADFDRDGRIDLAVLAKTHYRILLGQGG